MLVALCLLVGSFGFSNATPDHASHRNATHRRLRDTFGLGVRPRKPSCPGGYIDQTHGAAYWYDCAKTCPGQWPWATKTCGCACVQPEEYHTIMAERAYEEAQRGSSPPRSPSPGAAPAPSSSSGGSPAPAAGSYVAPAPGTDTLAAQSGSTLSTAGTASASSDSSGTTDKSSAPISLGPASKPRSISSASTSLAPGQQPVWATRPPTTTGPTIASANSDSEQSEGLSTAVLVGLIAGIIVLSLSACLCYYLSSWCAKKPKMSRVEPAPEEKFEPSGLQFSRPRMQQFGEQRIQPDSQLRQIAYPDVDMSKCYITRTQKEVLMHSIAGTAARQHPYASPTPSVSSFYTGGKSTIPSINSKASTRSPSPRPSVASTESKPPTPPNTDQ